MVAAARALRDDHRGMRVWAILKLLVLTLILLIVRVLVRLSNTSTERLFDIPIVGSFHNNGN